MQLSLFTDEELHEDLKFSGETPKGAMLQGKIYHQMPKPHEHKDVLSVDPEQPDYAWTPEDWDLHMDRKHPHIKYEEDNETENQKT